MQKLTGWSLPCLTVCFVGVLSTSSCACSLRICILSEPLNSRCTRERHQLWMHAIARSRAHAQIDMTAAGSGIKIAGQRNVVAPQLFRGKEFNFSKLGIGGLDTQFEQIFRRAFASRVFPPSVVERLGIHHVKGVLLFGPPGTGKTLIARQIGKMLNGREPKVPPASLLEPEKLSVSESETGTITPPSITSCASR